MKIFYRLVAFVLLRFATKPEALVLKNGVSIHRHGLRTGRLSIQNPAPYKRDHPLAMAGDFLNSANSSENKPAEYTKASIQELEGKLVHAAKEGDASAVTRILDSGQVDDDTLIKAFVISIQSEQVEIFRILLKKLPQNMLIEATDDGLFWAAAEGNISIIKDLTAARANPRYEDALIVAAGCGNLETVKYLAGVGAQLNRYGEEALAQAAEGGHIEIIEYLIEQGADPNAQDGEALIQAATGGHIAAIEYLIGKGVDPSAQNDEVLLQAAASGYITVIEYLAGKGVSLRSQDDAAIVVAAASGHTQTVQYLVEKGLDPNAFDGEALVQAAAGGHVGTMEYLIKYITDSKVWYLALQAAGANNQLMTFRYLQSIIPL